MEATTAAERSSPNKAPTTVDLENKLMEVGDRRYNLDMKQHDQSRFFSITDTSDKGRRSRVVVPMSACASFVEAVQKAVKFMDTYVPTNLSGSQSSSGTRGDKGSGTERGADKNGESMKFAFTTSMFTPAHRRYYFDVIDADDQLSLRISYVFADRRDSITLIYDCLTSLLEIINGFSLKYPSISPTDDYQVKGRRGDGRRPSARRGRGFGRRFEGERRGPRRGTFQGRGQGAQGERTNEHGERPESRKVTGLKVCADPAPVEFTNNAKKFQCEIVEGSNVFMRITEMINDSRKSTLHVPIECLTQLQTVLSEMGMRFTITHGSSPSTGPKP